MRSEPPIRKTRCLANNSDDAYCLLRLGLSQGASEEDFPRVRAKILRMVPSEKSSFSSVQNMVDDEYHLPRSEENQCGHYEHVLRTRRARVAPQPNGAPSVPRHLPDIQRSSQREFGQLLQRSSPACSRWWKIDSSAIAEHVAPGHTFRSHH